jgi:competence ComEA-like helix-hairpin-helix protein
MLKIRYWIKDFFGFPRSQVNGFLVLLTLLILLIFSEPAWHWWVAQRDRDRSTDRATLDSLLALWDTIDSIDTPPPVQKPFYFDPNKSTEDQFIALGFAQRLASRIIRYREKGGKFRIKSDLLKIYGVDTAFYQQIYSFITLPEIFQRPPKTVKKFTAKATVKPREMRPIFDLNKADTSALKAINGIGEKLSLRILKYRDVLGGFVSMDQLKDVYGLDSLVMKRLIEASLIEDGFVPAKLDINHATEKELSAHPYINKKAKVIVSYRFQHGDFKTVEDIRKVINMDEKNFQRIAAYLEVQEK